MSVPAISRLGWYARRLGRMSPAEIAWRVRQQAIRRAWRNRQVRPGQLAALPPLTEVLPTTERQFTSPLPEIETELRQVRVINASLTIRRWIVPFRKWREFLRAKVQANMALGFQSLAGNAREPRIA